MLWVNDDASVESEDDTNMISEENEADAARIAGVKDWPHVDERPETKTSGPDGPLVCS